MFEPSLDAATLKRKEWDVLVVGTGMGGATLGHALARMGLRVLFVERGSSHLGEASALTGRFAEDFFDAEVLSESKRQEILRLAGRWVEALDDVSDRQPRRFVPLVGAGTGGSSALYGMALERFFPEDFTPRGNFADVGDSTLPETWPISYTELQPFYREAEQLYRVRGTPDPLRRDEPMGHLLPPRALSPGNHELCEFFQSKGLHPYQIPMASEGLPECQVCQGYLCPRSCKNDAARMCLAPALEHLGASLLTECRVVELEASRTEVRSVNCVWRGHRLRLRARIVVLAAGALATPGLLLRSASAAWPRGLANDWELVGRNLMRHCIDLYFVPPKTRESLIGYTKEIAFNDLYNEAGRKFGTVQSFGPMPPSSVFLCQLESYLRRSSPWLAGLFRPLRPMVAALQHWWCSRTLVLASILEDLPYLQNRLTISAERDSSEGGGTRLEYRIGKPDALRLREFRMELRALLKPYGFLLAKQAANNTMIAHVCGTCRFGTDPRSSVLDAQNRAHGLSNLYVVDSSFFPSSAGKNPSLTIAANALRVAGHIAAHF